MAESEWTKLREPWERLKWARKHWQTKIGAATTKAAAAESLGMQENTYSAYERAPDSSKHTALDHQRAIQFGDKFKVNWVWLLTGRESPFARTPAQERALGLMAEHDEADQERAVDIIAAALKRRA
jgi:hypothetical protein